MRFLACTTLVKIKGGVFLLALLCLSRPVSATNRPFVDWQPQIKVVTRFYQDIEDDHRYEQEQEFEGRFIFENKISFPGQNILVNLDMQTRYNAFLGEDSDRDVDVTLEDVFIEFTAGNHVFSAGQETITWGKLDDDSLIDIINPQDYKLLFLLDKQERKLPAVMFRYDYNFDSSQIEALVMPVFESSKFRFFGNDWALFGHLKALTATSSASAAAKAVVQAVRVEDNDQLYDKSFKNMQFGLRFRSRMRDIDYDFYYMNIYHRLPTLREKTPAGNILKHFLYEPTTNNLANLLAAAPSNQDLTLVREHPRIHVMGLAMETVLGQCGIRAEAAVFLDKPYLRRDFSYLTKDSLSFGFALDHTTADNLYVKLGFREDIVFSYEDLFAQELYTHSITSRISKEFLRGKLVCSIDSSYNISRNDCLVNPKLTYKFNNGIDVSVGAFVMEGDSTTTYGRYSDKDLLYFEAIFRF